MPDRLMEAAKLIAEQAKQNASAWSRRIPGSIRVSGSYPEIVIRASAPPAYPNEMPDIWHPVFGRRGTKRFAKPRVENKHRPFLAPAADQRGDAAAEKFADIIDDWAIKAGFR